MHTRTRSIALVLPAVLLIAACGGGGASPSAAAPSEAPAASEPAASEPAASDATVALAETALGTVLVDAEGRTLYGFTQDTDGTSVCYDDCATAWPPLLAEGDATVGDGLDAALLTTVERTDGTQQLKYGDWPLYYFAADAAAGDTNGQNVNDVWFVIGADGALIRG
jgi:predicted lipoprotein with Yx(FWY)xxD motif